MDTRCAIGLPQWQHPDWHPDRPDGLQALARYARHFASVEGNHSFYGAPTPALLQRWQAHTPAHFRPCFKVPRAISHDAPLRHGLPALLQFLHTLEPFQARLGLVWLQLSDKLGPEQLPALEQLLWQLPAGFHFGVELRHPGFFDKSDAERELHQRLMQHGVNRVLFDTRALFADAAADPASLEARAKKPRVPLHVIATAERPMVRFISPLDTRRADTALQQWAQKVAQWVAEGRQPFLFFHTPDNRAAPALAADFARRLAAQLDGYAPPPPWPQPARQEALF